MTEKKRRPGWASVRSLWPALAASVATFACGDSLETPWDDGDHILVVAYGLADI